MTIEDGIHTVDETEPITSIDGRIAAYIDGACFHASSENLKAGDKVIVEDGMVEAKIEPLPEVEPEEEEQ